MSNWTANISDAIIRRASGKGVPAFFDREASPFPVTAPRDSCGGVDLAAATRQPNAMLPSIERMSQVPAHRTHRWGGR
jgi:hypothetical protein